MITLRNLEKFYEGGYGRSYVLRRINLEIQQGDFVTIMGPSGAGKSTLLSILGCWTAPGRASSSLWATRSIS